MDIGANQIVTQIASSTGGYLEVYAPVILLVAGIVLAIAVIERIITAFFGNSEEGDTITGDSNVK